MGPRLAVRPKPQTPAPDVYICSQAVMEKLSELGSGSRVAAVFDMLDRKFPNGMEAGDGGFGQRTAE